MPPFLAKKHDRVCFEKVAGEIVGQWVELYDGQPHVNVDRKVGEKQKNALDTDQDRVPQDGISPRLAAIIIAKTHLWKGVNYVRASQDHKQLEDQDFYLSAQGKIKGGLFGANSLLIEDRGF